jgi:hypothetical protein
MASEAGTIKPGISFAFLIAVPTGFLYNEWIIREGPKSRGQVKNSSKGE